MKFINPTTIIIAYFSVCLISALSAILIHYDMAEHSVEELQKMPEEIKQEIMNFAQVMTEIMRLSFGALLGALSMAWQRSLDNKSTLKYEALESKSAKPSHDAPSDE